MSVKIKKINLTPVAGQNVVGYLLEQVLKQIAPVLKTIDEYGAKYDHETPWKKAYFASPKFYLYRVAIGAVGRISNCKDAALLGITSRAGAKSVHFTSMALYFVYRIARQDSRKYMYSQKLEGWVNAFLNDELPNARYLNYYDLESCTDQ